MESGILYKQVMIVIRWHDLLLWASERQFAFSIEKRHVDIEEPIMQYVISSVLGVSQLEAQDIFHAMLLVYSDLWST